MCAPNTALQCTCRVAEPGTADALAARMRSIVVSLALVATACYPTLPPHLAEGTDVLPAGGINLNVAGGAGDSQVKEPVTGNNANEFLAGFDVRLRTGIGAHSEIGASVFGGVGTAVAGGDPPFGLGGKLSYKFGPTKWFAVVVDAGAMDFAVASVAVFGGDLALIFAPYTSANGTQLYVAGKGAFSIPVLQNATNVNEAIIVPVGLQLPLSDKVRMYFEAGPLIGFAQETAGGTTTSTNSFGGYGTVAATFLLR